jgi:archaellum biogenesis ATPase FlaH
MFHTLIDGFGETSVPNLLHEVIEQKRERNSLELTQALTTNKDEKVSELWAERELLISGDINSDDRNNVVIAPDLKEIFKARSAENRLSVTPPQLNEALEGGFLRGHHCVLFAVTDLGKTLFSLDLARNFITNGYKVLYVCNEDPLSDLLERFLVSFTGRDKWAVRQHYDKAQALAEKLGWDRMIWAELTPGTLGEIQSLIEEHKPDVLFVDQLRNLDVGENNFVRTLEKAAQGVRKLSKAHNLVAISITQAGDSADGKAVLGRGDIDNSNVGIPGTADLMLGIGATQDQEFNGIRTFSFPKNKVSGNKQPVLATFNTKIMRAE